MPSIEIVCVGQQQPLECGDLSFQVQASEALESHRGPEPLFQRDFDALEGCLYHLGNPSCRPGHTFYAYDLIVDEGDETGPLIFAAEHAPDVLVLLRRLLEASPCGRLVFTTDWQFGPKQTTRGGELTLDRFWDQHAAGALRMNGLYTIVAGRGSTS